MKENVTKNNSNFVDNVAYKSKFQFRIWVNDNVICQRYFKINGFNESLLYTKEFHQCLDDIVLSIKKDLVSKSRIFMWYTDFSDTMKLTGFSDDRVSDNTYMLYSDNNKNEYYNDDKPDEGEVIFKFSFLIDDKPFYENIWDGNIYPKFVRNGVDLTNKFSNDTKDTSSMNFYDYIIRHMQFGKTNIISDSIKYICNSLSNNYGEEESHVDTTMDYKDSNGRNYHYSNEYIKEYEKAVKKKTKDYISTLYLKNFYKK